MIQIGNVILMGDWDTSPPPAGVVVRLVPSFIEGAGWDTTTQAVLLAMQEMNLSGWRVLDFGAGTGVLALAAMVLGAKQADAVDWQASSREAINHNAQSNKIELGIYDKVPNKKYDLILCNLLGAVATREVLPSLADHLEKNGKIILTSQSADVGSLELEAEMKPQTDIRNGEWYTGVLSWHK